MTHHVHPFAHRLGILRDWQSRWFARGNDYQAFLRSDVLIRKHLDKVLRDMYVSGVEMERQGTKLKIVIKTSRPGLIIGRSGEGISKLKKNLDSFVAANKLAGVDSLKLDVEEVKSPESHAAIVGAMVREGIEKRMPFRRVLKQTADKVMANRDVQGMRINLSGRLAGADMARREAIKKGRIPLQTFRADIDYAHVEAHIPQGQIGIRVWIYRGDVFEDK
ncbi:MAG: 30S ribosomal protein S3 [Candidatus Pacebacteria bacterium]|nr:30S ribosomal protein S3 [Candidatus Paceibacterota bacterium]